MQRRKTRGTDAPFWNVFGSTGALLLPSFVLPARRPSSAAFGAPSFGQWISIHLKKGQTDVV